TVGQDVVTDAFRHDLDDPAIEQIESKLFELATAGQAQGGLRSLDIASAINRAEAAHKGQSAGLATGFRDLDNKLGGFQAANLIILAGRPSMGKSSLAIGVALNAATARNTVAIFSLEMSRREIEDRVLAERAGIPS